MKLRIEAPTEHLEHVLKEFGVKQVSRGSALALIPDPTKTVVLKDYPKVKLIVTPSTGTNHIDLAECKRRNIKVLSLLDDREGLETIHASSEFALFMILAGLRNGAFRQWKNYNRHEYFMLGRELYRKQVGLVGFGRIGHNLAKYLEAFGVERWLYHDPANSGSVSLQHIFKESDIVVICCSLNEQTTGMINKTHLNLLKPAAVLVNVARAEIIHEPDLLEWAAKKGQYVTDVLHGEVSGNVNSSLLSMANVQVYPHLAGHTQESNEKALRIALTMAQKEIGE